jgi:hypothetical protein
VAEALDISEATLAGIADNSIEASFLDRATKDRLKAPDRT